MAKVVKIDKSKMKIITHSECGAVIKYFESEVKSEWKSDYGGGSDLYHYLICPNCGKTMRWC